MALFWLFLAMLNILYQKHTFKIAFFGILSVSSSSCPLNQIPFITEIQSITPVFLLKTIIFTLFPSKKPVLMAKYSHFVFYRHIYSLFYLFYTFQEMGNLAILYAICFHK